MRCPEETPSGVRRLAAAVSRAAHSLQTPQRGAAPSMAWHSLPGKAVCGSMRPCPMSNERINQSRKSWPPATRFRVFDSARPHVTIKLKFAVLLVSALPATVIAAAQEPAPQCVEHVESLTYPEIARAAHVQGVVILQIVVGKDGKVMSASRRSGPAILAKAAEDNAVRWVFRPDEPRTTELRYEFRLGPAATSANVVPQVSFDFPDHITILMPALPINP